MAKTMIAALKAAVLPVAALSAAIPGAAYAQAAAPAVTSAAPSDSAMVNLVRLLIEQGVITREKGTALMQQALTEAQAARAAAPTQTAELPMPAPGTVRVPYIPETVRAQIKEELRTEVLAQAKTEGWASPGEGAPDWTRRITLYGDLRVRSESDLFSKTNSDRIFDFARINALGPLDVLDGGIPLPLINSRIDRKNELRLRARLGVRADISRGVEAGLLLATGDDNGPISNNATLGGGFGKRDFWLQEAWLKVKPTGWSSVTLGRMPNPFTSTDLMFDPDLSFDGIAGEIRFTNTLNSGIGLAIRGGAFPIDFGDATAFLGGTSSDQNGNFTPNAQSTAQRYLFSAQVEASAEVAPGIKASLAGAYHSFDNIQGRFSEPCLLYLGATQCSTDNLRPLFLGKGNTASPLRNIFILQGVDNRQPQFFGLTFDYDVINVTAALSFPVSDTVGVRLTGDYVRNIGFKRSDLCRNGLAGQPLNNGGSNGSGNICGSVNPTSFVGGNEGYQGIVQLGYDSPRKWGEWQATAGYRYLQSDAVLAAFTDSDFHLGGTNAKGYFVGAKVGLLDGVSFGGRWLSANEISGEPLSIDVLLLDINAAF